MVIYNPYWVLFHERITYFYNMTLYVFNYLILFRNNTVIMMTRRLHGILYILHII